MNSGVVNARVWLWCMEEDGMVCEEESVFPAAFTFLWVMPS